MLAYLSLGSNIGDRAANLQRAIEHLAQLGKVTAVSHLYETEPMEVTEQRWFFNCAVALETSLSPQELLASVLAIEKKMGRDRATTPPKGPRILDIDVILYGELVLDTPELVIPHPAMHLRRFVLAPLAEIAPDAIHPVFMRPFKDLLLELSATAGAVRRLKNVENTA